MAAQVGAGFLVGGRVAREGYALRVTVELVEAATGRHAWGERYEVAARAIEEVEEEIASQVRIGRRRGLRGPRVSPSDQSPGDVS